MVSFKHSKTIEYCLWRLFVRRQWWCRQFGRDDVYGTRRHCYAAVAKFTRNFAVILVGNVQGRILYLYIYIALYFILLDLSEYLKTEWVSFRRKSFSRMLYWPMHFWPNYNDRRNSVKTAIDRKRTPRCFVGYPGSFLRGIEIPPSVFF